MTEPEKKVYSLAELREIGEANYRTKERFVEYVKSSGILDTIENSMGVSGYTLHNNLIAIGGLLDQELNETDIMFDKHHTVGELYAHRITLFITVMGLVKTTGKGTPWYSHKHHDGEQWGTSIITGITMEDGRQITYHVPAEYEEKLQKVASYVDYAPEYDGHTPMDTLDRLLELI